MQNKLRFKHIGLMGRAGKVTVVHTLHQVLAQLKKLGLTPVVDAETAKLPNFIDADSYHAAQLNKGAAQMTLSDAGSASAEPSNTEPSSSGSTSVEPSNKKPSNLMIVPREDMGNVCDLVIVVGGDGSILHAGRVLAQHDVPVLGINRGRLGFLADVNPDDVLSKLAEILKGDYTLDKRFLLKLEVRNEVGNTIHDAMALNDVVLHAGKSVHMIDFEMTIDGHYVYRQHSDGLIFATPTGSTAYSLSAGGPIIYPNMDAIALVPLNPHALSSRPIVVNGNSHISIQIHADNRMQPMVSADGQSGVPIEANHTLHISKHPNKLLLLHPPGYDFYAACRTKLGWNAKSFD